MARIKTVLVADNDIPGDYVIFPIRWVYKIDPMRGQEVDAAVLLGLTNLVNGNKRKMIYSTRKRDAQRMKRRIESLARKIPPRRKRRRRKEETQPAN